MAITTDAECQAYLGLSSIPTLLTTLRPYAERAVKDYLRYDPEQQQHTEILPNTRRSSDRDNLVDVSGGKVVFFGSATANNMLVLKHLPVRDSNATGVSTDPQVFEDYDARFGQASGAFSADTELTRGTEFFLEYDQLGISKSGTLIGVGGNWPSLYGTVKVVYTAGYSSDELAGTGGDADASDIKLATLITVSHIYKQAVLNGSTGAAGLVSGAIVSESLGDYSYTVSGGSAERSGYSRGALPAQVMRMLDSYRSYRGAFTR